MHIHKAQAFSYRVPRTSSSSSQPTNFVVLLRARSQDGRSFEALGEGQPRTWRTGDDAGDSWKFLAEAVGKLHGHEFSTPEPESALETVRRLMQDFAELAAEHSADDYKRPFRGTLLGVEVALLDLAAKVRNITVAELMGQKRDAAPLAPPASSPKTRFNRLRRQLAEQAASYERVRLTGSENTAQTLDFLELVTTTNRRRKIGQPNKPLWVDLNGALTREQASEFVREVVTSASNYLLPPQVAIEQPVPVRYGDHLAILQREADEAIAESGRPELDVRIVGDESIWDEHSLGRLRKLGGLRAVNIRPAQAGGLLASIELAERALRYDPDTLIFLTRMIGASRITASALRHVALALPKVDSAVVASVVEHELEMTKRVKTEEELADEAWQAAAPGAEDPPSEGSVDQAGSALNGRAEMIHRDADDEPESDDDEDPEDFGASERNTSEPGDGGRRPEEMDEPFPEDEDEAAEDEAAEDVEINEDDAEQHSDDDPIRRFRVREVPGIGVELLFAGMAAAVKDGVTYPAPPPETYNGTPVTIYDDVDDLHPLGPNGSKGHLLERQALALGLNTTRYSKGAFTATDGAQDAINFKWSRNPLSSAVSLALCTHKEATRMQLQRTGVPVPQGRTFASGDFATAKQFVERIGYPVVVKPAMGVRGIGVVAGIQDEPQLEAAFEIMGSSKLGNQDFIVEKHVMGEDYRILVVGDEVVAAILREPASVTGDGHSTIAELLINKNTARKRNPHLWARPAKYDAAAQHELQKSDRDLESVLPKGERQLLANTCSLSQGGDSIDVLDQLHPSIKEASVNAVNAIPNMEYCGVDFLLEDHTKPLDQQDAGICELNAHAAIGNCEYPMFGTPRPVAEALMRACVDHYGLNVPDKPAETISLHLTIRGRVTRVGFRRWLQRRAKISGVQGWVRNINRRTMEAVLVGPTAPTTAVASAAILGSPRALPSSYDAVHIEPPEQLHGFEIRSTVPARDEAVVGSQKVEGRGDD